MFAPQDHLPLDRIITRFSAPTTITQFQRSSSDGILIELARLVTHAAKDNIFCLPGLIESTLRERERTADDLGWGKKKGWGGLVWFGSKLSCWNPGEPQRHRLADAPVYNASRTSLPCKCPCKLRAGRAWCMVGDKRVHINTCRETQPPGATGVHSHEDD